MAGKQSLKQGEKLLFGIFGIFLVAALIGYIALEAFRLTSDTPMFEARTHYVFTEKGHQGSRIFREAKCTSCHRAMRNGTNMGLNLDGIGSKRSEEWLLKFMRDPEATYGAPTLDHGFAPKEASYVSSMPLEDLEAIASFLSGLRSDQGSASSPVPPKGASGFIDGAIEAFAPEEWKSKYQDVREREQ